MNTITNTLMYKQVAATLTSEETIKLYRVQLRRLNGEQFNEKTKIDYRNGWIYLNAANGHCGVYRKWQIVEMTNTLVRQGAK